MEAKITGGERQGAWGHHPVNVEVTKNDVMHRGEVIDISENVLSVQKPGEAGPKEGGWRQNSSFLRS